MLSPEEILNIIVAFLSENGIEYTAIMDDGRVNSAINEEQVKGVIERCFNQNPVLRDGGYKYVPSNIRDWYDFGVSKDGDSDFFIPVNIKVSVLNTDNLNCKLGIYYALTGMLPSGMSNEIQWEPFCQALHRDMNTKTDGDYYFLVANKKDNKDFFWTSLKQLKAIIPNGNNLPFQANWSVNRERVQRSHVDACRFILSAFKESVYKRCRIKDVFDEYLMDFLQDDGGEGFYGVGC